MRMKMLRSQAMVNLFFARWCDYNMISMKTGNLVCFHWCMLTPHVSLHLTCWRNLCREVSLSQTLLSSSSSSFLLFHPLLFITSPFPLCCLCVCVCVFLLLGLRLPLLAEGDYCPWNRELQSGLWLEKYLTDEEDVGTFKGSSLWMRLQ